ncbi:glycoside hydrolase family 43 protein [Sodaliphilus sp.]|uniref:glycoside hydrolase family 43 protein n=1 Tax=Sodaliphilus sp. TaxID=2815818 RepID=UPI00388FDE87
MKTLSFIIFSIIATSMCAMGSFTPGEKWADTDGRHINAHGGGIMYHNGTYYWYGEYKGDYTYRSPGVGWECYRAEAGGVSCYSSKDLYNWKFEGIALSPDTVNTHSDIHPTMVIERPKVIYNETTGKFVMWMHIDNHDYGKASAGVAVGDSPTGPFTYIESVRPNGQIARDLTVYKDDDGKAYLIYSSEGNATMQISQLTADYLKTVGTYTRNFADKFREAPAIFKRGGKYYIVSSGCTGWSPNEAEYAVADCITGPYTAINNPCRGKDADKTFYGQSTFVLPVQGVEDTFIMMFDKWNKVDLIDSRYIWLPIKFEGDELTVPWQDQWSL